MDLRNRQNSFTFLRLVFALAVVFSHSYAIGGFGPEPLLRWTEGQMQFGFTAVLCFFVISGFLISASAERQPLGWFVVNRAARILPGFWAVQLITALVLAPILIMAKHEFVEGYFHSLMVGKASALSYISENAFVHIRQYQIADLFRGQPAGAAVNGSLWSLGPEITCYLYLALFAVVGASRSRIGVSAVFIAAYSFHVLACLEPASIVPLARFAEFGAVFQLQHVHFRSVYVAFTAGMVCFQFRDYLLLEVRWFAAAVLFSAGSLWFWSFDFVWPLTLPYIILFLAYRLPLRPVEQWGDFSFGIYIYSFPIQQCLVLAGLHRHGVATFVLMSIGLSVIAGVLSWRFVEAPVLAWVRAMRASRGRSRDVQVEPVAAGAI